MANKSNNNSAESQSGTETKDRNEAFIPYADLGEDFENVPIYLRADAHFYKSRMGFFPNANRLYLYNPWIAKPLIDLNNAIMRDERNQLDEHLKYRLAFTISQTNKCTYCTSHHAGTLKGRFDYDDDSLEAVLTHENHGSEAEEVAVSFVREASLDPEGVTDEMRAQLAAYFTPAEVMEIITLLGFWSMYNTMHAAMALPVEEKMTEFEKWVEVGPAD